MFMLNGKANNLKKEEEEVTVLSYTFLKGVHTE